MKFLIIIPAHNEEQNIYYTLKSLEEQSFDDFSVVVVNDGSTDKTEEITKQFTAHNPKFELVNLQKSEHQPGAKVVRTFNRGLEFKNVNDFDIICKFDADIIFPKNYLEELNKIYENNPKIGMLGGLVRITKQIFDKDKAFDFQNEKNEWQFENLSSKNHIRGPIKSYRKQCFSDMKGLRPVLGWDNIDVMLAKMYDWETFTIKDLWVKHLRPTAYKYNSHRAEKLGEYFYNIGLDVLLAVMSSAKSSFKNHSLSEFFITMRCFFRQKHKRELSSEEIKFIRKLRYQQIFSKK